MLSDFPMGNSITSLLAKTSFQRPIVVILGCTGSGKSKLAIQIAKKFDGEIISADSMQLYKGLDIITNKVTPEEQCEALHHFINCADPLSRYTVVDFRNRALPLIDKLLNQNKLPIIVGGTNYYIESLLYEVLIKPEDLQSDRLICEWEKSLSAKKETESKDIYISSPNSVSEECTNTDKTEISSSTPAYVKSEFPGELCSSYNSIEDIFSTPITQDSFKDLSNEVLHGFLHTVDPVMAEALHPNERRRIIRSLQVFQQHQRCHSDLIAEQKSLSGGSSAGGPLRYKNSLMLWLQCDKNVLNERLDKRVDQMIENGLITELLNFHSAYNDHRIKQNLKPDYTKGIFQSIGFKEFHDYLLLSPEERENKRGKELCQKGTEDVKQVTKQYAQKQIKWIVNRFLRKPDRQVPPVYALDATDVEVWGHKVFNVACHIIECALQDIKPNIDPLPVEERPPSNENKPVTYFCDICEQRIVGSHSWKVHTESRRHQRRKASLKKRKLESEYAKYKQSL